MSSQKILIVEDELIIASHIEALLSEKGYQIVDTVTKGELVPGIVAKDRPDAIIMDINLAGQLDGIETAKIISQTAKVPIIFLTSYVDDVTFNKSKAAYPRAFLSKPFEAAELFRALELVFNSPPHQESLEDESVIEGQLGDRIFIKDKDRSVKLETSDILYIEADRNYCRITTVQKSYVLSVPLKSIEKKISSPNLVRIHRSYVVNISHIEELDEHYVFIRKKSIPIGKVYKKDLARKLKLI